MQALLLLLSRKANSDVAARHSDEAKGRVSRVSLPPSFHFPASRDTRVQITPRQPLGLMQIQTSQISPPLTDARANGDLDGLTTIRRSLRGAQYKLTEKLKTLDRRRLTHSTQNTLSRIPHFFRRIVEHKDEEKLMIWWVKGRKSSSQRVSSTTSCSQATRLERVRIGTKESSDLGWLQASCCEEQASRPVRSWRRTIFFPASCSSGTLILVAHRSTFLWPTRHVDERD